MSDSRIHVDDLAREWRQDLEFRAEYDALEGEFALATALIEARARAALTQAQVAARMGTTQNSSERHVPERSCAVGLGDLFQGDRLR